jgi:AraC-like DNA-binding protein
MSRRIDYSTLLRLERARELIAVRLDTPVSLAEAAREACLSPFHFHRLFAQAYGQTPHAFMTARRLEHAKRLLAETDHTVTDICFALGYESLGSFSTRFQRLVGCTPTEYRAGARRFFAVSRIRAHRFVPTCFAPSRQTSPTAYRPLPLA